MGWKRRLAVMFGLLLLVAGIWLFETDLPVASVDARYANDRSQFLDLGTQGRIHYRDQGNPSGPVLLLIHGSNASLHTWEPWVAELGDYFRVVSLDLPGHGLTGRTPADEYGSDAYVATVHALAEHLNFSDFVLGGNSMGGGVSWRYALRHTVMVRALVLVDASGPYEWRRPATTEATQTSRRQRPLAFRLLGQPWFRRVARYLDPYYLVVQGLKASHYDPAFVDQALIDRYYQLSMRAGTRSATLKRFGSQRASSGEAAALSALRVPTLILWGDQDGVIPVSVGERFAQELPNATLVRYPQVGHIPMEEIPARSAADVRSFVNNLEP